MTMSKLYAKLRKSGRGQYLLLAFCIFLSVLLITAFAVMYFSPTVQNFLPQGGDTRKMASLLMAVTAIGCSIFTVYASRLFFRYKSREYGVLMAMGVEKGTLSSLLFQELSMVVLAASLMGLLLALPLSFGIWKLFTLFIVSTEQMTYQLGFTGLLLGTAFAAALLLLLALSGRRFIRSASVMSILKTQHQSETVREIKPWTFPAGLLLTVTGILLGSGLPQLAARAWSYSMPALWNLTYLLSVAGIYLMLLSLVSQSRLKSKKNKDKYCKNLVSISLMRFTAKATTRNMCVIVLLLFVCCFSSFYGMQYSLAPDMLSGGKDSGTGSQFSLHYPVLERQITRDDIYTTAEAYDMEITDFVEKEGANLVISYTARDFTEDGSRYIEVDKRLAKTALFLSASDYGAVSGQAADVKPGEYLTVVPKDYSPNFFYFEDGLYAIASPEDPDRMSREMTWAGSVASTAIYTMSEPFAYIISDEDYAAMTAGLSDDWREHLVFFDVADVENSYDFARDLLSRYVARCTGRSNHIGYWDAWEEKQALARGEEYGYGGGFDLSMENSMLLGDWRYAPQFNIITLQDQMQLICVYVMLCLYIFLISLAAISVMTYVRSISVATDNRELFVSLDKLGADRIYKRNVLKKQLARIFQYPAAVGCSLGLLFSLAMDLFNDGRITGTEINALLVLLLIIAAVCALLYVVYRAAMRKAEAIVGM